MHALDSFIHLLLKYHKWHWTLTVIFILYSNNLFSFSIIFIFLLHFLLLYYRNKTKTLKIIKAIKIIKLKTLQMDLSTSWNIIGIMFSYLTLIYWVTRNSFWQGRLPTAKGKKRHISFYSVVGICTHSCILCFSMISLFHCRFSTNILQVQRWLHLLLLWFFKNHKLLTNMLWSTAWRSCYSS